MDGGATVSFIANTTPVIHQRSMVLHSRRGRARTESRSVVVFNTLHQIAAVTEQIMSFLLSGLCQEHKRTVKSCSVQ